MAMATKTALILGGMRPAIRSYSNADTTTTLLSASLQQRRVMAHPHRDTDPHGRLLDYHVGRWSVRSWILHHWTPSGPTDRMPNGVYLCRDHRQRQAAEEHPEHGRIELG
jgi:hypothetical protein